MPARTPMLLGPASSWVIKRTGRERAAAEATPSQTNLLRRARAQPCSARLGHGAQDVLKRRVAGNRLGVVTPRGRRVSVEARRGGGYDDTPTAAERVVAALPYLLPLLDGLRYGKFFFLEFPQAQLLFLPLQPILQLYTTLPFASVLVFFGLYLGIVQNQNYSRFVRFNGQQAILLDILLILPSLLESLFRPPTGGFGLSVFVSLYNTVWLYVAISFVYAVGACLLGKKVLLPLVGEGADQQVM